jgi:predicted enzyme related to lactoylglutathione lyase
MIRMRLHSIMVEDQAKALKFYTEVIGFQKKQDLPVGPYRWISVIAAGDSNELELALEPNANPAGKAFQEAMFSQRIPVAAFEVDDIAAEFARLRGLGVAFTQEPTRMGPVQQAVFSDTVGNLIQLYQVG